MYLQIAWQLWSRQKTRLHAEIVIDTIFAKNFPKTSTSIIDGITLVRKLNCATLTLDKQLMKPLVLQLHWQICKQDRYHFSIYMGSSIKNAEKEKRCPNVLSFKKDGINIVRQWNVLLGDNKSKYPLIKFLVISWRRNKLSIKKDIPATNGIECVCLSDSKYH